MNFASEEYVRVPSRGDTSGQKCPVKVGHSSGRKFGRVPSHVASDPRLTYRDKAVYIALALFERRGIVNTGIRFMAKANNISKSHFARGVEALNRCGHIARQESLKRGQRQTYSLRSVVFGRKEASPPVVIPAPRQSRSTVKCPECRKPCRGLLRAGWCRSCAWDRKVRRIAQEEIVRTA